jgi:hypothetical protein
LKILNSFFSLSSDHHHVHLKHWDSFYRKITKRVTIEGVSFTGVMMILSRFNIILAKTKIQQQQEH